MEKQNKITIYFDKNKKTHMNLFNLIKSGTAIRIGDDSDESSGSEILLRLALYAQRQLGMHENYEAIPETPKKKPIDISPKTNHILTVQPKNKSILEEEKEELAKQHGGFSPL